MVVKLTGSFFLRFNIRNIYTAVNGKNTLKAHRRKKDETSGGVIPKKCFELCSKAEKQIVGYIAAGSIR